jgi:CubicO group peptidase (beta-lactamase class C family)
MVALLAALAMSVPAAAQVPDAERIATLARSAMAQTGAKGLAVAAIDGGQVASVQALGTRNAKGEPLTADTVMYGASLTKAVFAYTVMQLVEDGKVDLDRSVAEYLPRPLPAYGNLDAYGNWGDLAGDERWRSITPRILLTHSAGFANFSWDEPDERLRIHFAPGSRYAYSGEGIILLQFAIEQGLGLKLGTRCSGGCSTASA